MAAWGFLTNDGLVLTYVSDHPDSTGVEIAQAVRITERSARKILANLQAGSVHTFLPTGGPEFEQMMVLKQQWDASKRIKLY